MTPFHAIMTAAKLRKIHSVQQRCEDRLTAANVIPTKAEQK
jgi:hypothetical protein